jgi:hypothetical protein
MRVMPAAWMLRRGSASVSSALAGRKWGSRNAFDEHFDLRLTVAPDDCDSHVNGIVQHLTSFPDAALLLGKAKQCSNASVANAVDAASWWHIL